MANIGLLARTLETYDYVFSQDFPANIVKGGDSRELFERLSNVMLFPTISFAAFQPDLVYLLDADNGNNALVGPLRPYHSALAVVRLPQLACRSMRPMRCSIATCSKRSAISMSGTPRRESFWTMQSDMTSISR